MIEVAEQMQEAFDCLRCPECRRGWLERVQTDKTDFDDGSPIIYSIYECDYCEARIKSQFEVESTGERQ